MVSGALIWVELWRDRLGGNGIVGERSWLTCLRYRYPPKMIPEIDITVCTTATNDKDARLLLSAMGVPFHGKHVN